MKNMTFPEQFRERTRDVLGAEYDAFESALSSDPPVSIRLNGAKCAGPLSLDRVPWCEMGYYLPSRPLFTMDPLFHGGLYYVQEASSMFLEQAFRQYVDAESPCVLDLCAAPGGKSTHLASLMAGMGVLVSNEVIRTRVKVLAENLTKWGAPNVVVTNNDPSDFAVLRGFFDVVVVDAPCSGEGMFRKDAASVAEWSVDNVKLCSERQRRILADVYPALKEGGLLVYSTCTYSREEDEDNVRWVADELGAEILPLDVPAEWNVSSDGLGYHFYPHKTKGEGFFLSLLRKTAPAGIFRRRQSKNAISSKIPPLLSEWVVSPSDYAVRLAGDVFTAVPKSLSAVVDTLASELRVLQAGVALGRLKGKDVLPDPALALSLVLRDGAFPVVDLPWSAAVDFLRRENILLPDAPKGWVLVSFQGHPLGFVKNLGTRANNTYPQDWRIRMASDPEHYEPVLSAGGGAGGGVVINQGIAWK